VLKPRLLVLLSMVFAAAMSRLIPHPPNMTSIAAVALFGGAYFSDKRLAFAVPVAALFLSDLVLGLYRHMEVVYLSFALVVLIGAGLQRRRAAPFVAGAAVLSSALFFAITNFGVWVFEPLYPKTVAGLIGCYVAAIPFFWNTLTGDLLYTLVLFGGFALLEKQFFSLREPATDGLSRSG
jgi:hypothetical protein